MSLRDKIPQKLLLGEAIVSIALEEDVGVYETEDYVLIEISHNAGRLNIPKIAQTVSDLVKADRKMVAVRGFGFKGIGLGVRIAHEIKKMEKRFLYHMTFDTFDAQDPSNNQYLTSVQIVIIPPEK